MNNEQKPTGDIRVELRFRNNLILAKMEETGLKTVAELSRATKIDHRRLSLLINMQELPTAKKDGRWRVAVTRLADFFKCMPEDFFSKFQQENALAKNRADAEMHFGEIQAMLANQNARLLEPDALAEAKELRVVLEQVMNQLSPRSQFILRSRFGFDGEEMTLEEIGKELGVSRARVRQIEQRAIRFLKHRDRQVPLREASGYDV